MLRSETRPAWLLRAIGAAVVGLLAVEAAIAQFYNPFAPRSAPDPRYAPPPSPSPFFRPSQPPPGYYPGRPAGAPYYDRRNDSYFTDPSRLIPPRTGPSLEEQRAEEERARAARRRAAERARARAAAAEAARLKAEAATHVIVFGDKLAESVSAGLDDIFEDNPAVAVVRKLRADGGLAQSDDHNWEQVVRETLAGSQKTLYAVVMLGANDRQAIREGDVTHELLSERWRYLYGERVAALLRIFRDSKVPVVWVGGPPLRNERQSGEMSAINDILRERVQREGGIYVDIWPGFVDDENKYATSGPDVAGQVARLRLQDGVSFTRAGARKAAHFVDIELRRLMGDTTVAALPGAASLSSQPSAPGPLSPRDAARDAEIDQRITASLPLLPEPPDVISPALRPPAGPVVPLTAADVAAGGALATSAPALQGDAAFIAERALRDGVAPPPRAGRADDFRWPRI